MKRLSLILLVLLNPVLCSFASAAEEKIALTPSAPYDRFIVFESLALFWIGIIGLIVIIWMNLKEVERTQRMGLDKEEKDAPLLD
jgi:hypothetical protein